MQTMSLSTASKNVAPVPVTEQLSLTEYDQLVSILQEGAFDNEALTRALEALRVYFRASYVTLILKVVGIEELGADAGRRQLQGTRAPVLPGLPGGFHAFWPSAGRHCLYRTRCAVRSGLANLALLPGVVPQLRRLPPDGRGHLDARRRPGAPAHYALARCSRIRRPRPRSLPDAASASAPQPAHAQPAQSQRDDRNALFAGHNPLVGRDHRARRKRFGVAAQRSCARAAGACRRPEARRRSPRGDLPERSPRAAQTDQRGLCRASGAAAAGA